MKKLLLASACAFGLSSPILAQVNYGDLPSANFPPSGWGEVQPFSTNGWTVLDVTDAADVGSTNVITPNTSSIDSAQKIKDIVATLSSPTVLYFPEGVYYLSTDLELSASNLVLRGDGKVLTEMRITAPAADSAEINFSGGGLQTEIDVTNFPSRGDNTIEVASATGLAVGDVVHVYDKDGGFIWGVYNYGQMAKITAISGNTLTLDMKLGLDLVGDPKVREISVIEKLGVESMTVTRDKAADEPNTGNIRFRFVDQAYVREVESSWVERAGIISLWTLDLSITDSDVHDAYDYGAGGQGYGFQISTNTTRCTVANNKAWNLRHHFMAHLGANHCVFAYNSAEADYNGVTGDLNTHGSVPHNVLFEGNMGRDLKWDGRSELNAGQFLGQYNVAFRNRTLSSGDEIEIIDPWVAGNTPHDTPTLFGNVTSAINIESGTTNEWVGGNRVNGSVVWGDASSGGTYPSSLYTTTKPAYLGTKPWPLYGPGVGSDFGATNTLPSYDRAKPSAASGIIIVDDGDAEHSDSNDWTTVSGSGGYQGDYRHDGNVGSGSGATRYSLFQPSGLSGNYDVYVHWKAAADRATNATVRIFHVNGSLTKTAGAYDDYSVDMTQGDSVDGEWHMIGANFEMDATDYVAINNNGANGFVIADAVKLEPSAPPAAIVIDDGDAEHSDSGNWTTITGGGGHEGDYRHDGNAGSGSGSTRYALFQPSGLSGTYKVYVYWKADANRATNATVRIFHVNGSLTKAAGAYDDYSVDMTQGNSVDGEWHQIGTTFVMDSTDYVAVNNNGANGYVIADAVKLEPQ